VCLAIPARIIEFLPQPALALVEVGQVRRRVNVDLLRDENLALNDWVLVHVGFAMSKISAKDAEEQMRLLAFLGEEQQAIQELEGYRFG